MPSAATWDRTDAEYEADLHLGYPIKLGGVEVNFLVDVFNLLNRQGETGRDDHYNLDENLDVLELRDRRASTPRSPRALPCATAAAARVATPPAATRTSTPRTPGRPRAQIRLGVRVTF